MTACMLAPAKTHSQTVFLNTRQRSRSSRQRAWGRAGRDAGGPGLGFNYAPPLWPLCGAFEITEDCVVSSRASVCACLNSWVCWRVSLEREGEECHGAWSSFTRLAFGELLSWFGPVSIGALHGQVGCVGGACWWAQLLGCTSVLCSP